jgi:2',3'-cyclic-nucleotide 2'-phosphodiesterase (5'-nucleotidase family)
LATRVPATYEGRAVVADPMIAAAMAPELARVAERRATQLGVVLETAVPRVQGLETPLGNLFAQALLESSPGADLAINNSGRGGLRGDLPVGPLTLGTVFDTFPFDNRLVEFTLSGAELREVFANEVRQRRRGPIGMAGVRVQVTCGGTEVAVDLLRSSGEAIHDEDRLRVVTTDQLASGGLFGIFRTSLTSRLDVAPTLPLLREVVASWLQRRGGVLRAEEFAGPSRPRWEFFGAGSDGCGIRPAGTR